MGAPNYAMAIHWACQAAWLTEQAALAARLEHNLHTKVIEPGFCYGESDSHCDAAPLRAVTGRYDEARRWVDRIGLPNLLPRIDDFQARLAE